MEGLKTKLYISIIAISLVSLPLSSCVSKSETSSNLDYVDPHIGGVGFLLQPTRPTVQLPNQMIRMHPMRADYLDDQISFFPLTMRSHRDGELFGIMPYVSSVNDEAWKNRQTYDHDLETARPFFYSTYFIDKIS